MKMTLRQFTEGSGVPPSDTHCILSIDEQYPDFYNCVRNKAYINRGISCGGIDRIRRKLHYDYGIGHIPLKSDTSERPLLYWGCGQRDLQLESVKSLFHQLADLSAANRFVVMLGKSDDIFGPTYAQLIPKSVRRIWVANCDAEHPRVQWYPLGRDFNNADLFNIAPKANKSRLVYSNFSAGTHPVRQLIHEALSGKDFITQVNVDGYGRYTGYPLTNEGFVNELNDHAFSISPRGNGIDTFRMWESLHLGVVPITVREACFQDHLTRLPILFLDRWEDFGELTQSDLEKTYQRMLDTEYDFSMLTASYWSTQFLSSN
jgi:hypothetical protein